MSSGERKNNSGGSGDMPDRKSDWFFDDSLPGAEEAGADEGGNVSPEGEHDAPFDRDKFIDDLCADISAMTGADVSRTEYERMSDEDLKKERKNLDMYLSDRDDLLGAFGDLAVTRWLFDKKHLTLDDLQKLNNEALAGLLDEYDGENGDEGEPLDRERIIDELCTELGQLVTFNASRDRLEQMSDDELRNRYEYYVDYLKSRERWFKRIDELEMAEWLREKKHLSRADLDKMENYELGGLCTEFNSEKRIELRRERLLMGLNDSAVAEWLKDKRHLTRGDIKRLSVDEIEQLLADYKQEQRTEEAEPFDRKKFIDDLCTEIGQMVVSANPRSELETLSDSDIRTLHEQYEKYLEERRELLENLNDPAVGEWLKDTKHLARGDIKKKTNRELEVLLGEFRGTSPENDEQAERGELLAGLNDLAISEWLKNEKHLTRGDIKRKTNDELRELLEEYRNRNTGAVPEQQGQPDNDWRKRMIAVRLGREKDAREAARDIAEHWIEEKAAGLGRFKGMAYRVIFGQMFREGTMKHYEKKAYEMISEKQHGENSSLSDRDWSTDAGLEQFVQAYVRGLENELIHGDAGEKMDTYGIETVRDNDGTEHKVVKHYWVDNEGNRHEEVENEDSAMAKATKGLYTAIERFARDGDRHSFDDAITVLNQNLAQSGENPDALMADNYRTVAEAARDAYVHTRSTADVEAGFRFINGEARSNVRTEAHRDALDKITDKLTNSRIGRVLPPEIVGAAASAAVYFGKTPLRTALVAAGTAVVGATFAPAVVPLAVGVGVAGVTAAIRERNRVTGDRASQARDLARGDRADDVVGSASATGRRKRYLKKAEMYDKEMAKVQYETISVADSARELKEAIESGDRTKIAERFAMVDMAIKMSDRRGIDLITYSNADAKVISDERMQLDIVRAEAKVKLRELGGGDRTAEEELSGAVEHAKDVFENDISAKDSAFKKLRMRRAAGAGLKSAIVSGLMQVGTQEVVAIFNQGQVGLAETGINELAKRVNGQELTQNTDEAQKTLLAGLVGLKTTRNYDAVLQKGAELSKEQIKKFEDDPNYTVVRGNDKIVSETQTISTREALDGVPNGSRDVWLNNGTTRSDANELAGYYSPSRGVYTEMSGTAFGGGKSIDISGLTSKDVGFMVKIGDTTKWIPASGSAGNFTPDLSNQPRWLADIINGRQFDNISCVYNNGVGADGVISGSSFWTFFGSGTAPETITTTVEKAIPTWDVIQHVTGGVTKEVAQMPILPGVISRVQLPPLGRHTEDDRGQTDGGDGEPASQDGPTGAPVPVGEQAPRSNGATPQETPTPRGGENLAGADDSEDNSGAGPDGVPAPRENTGARPTATHSEGERQPSGENTVDNDTDDIDDEDDSEGGDEVADMNIYPQSARYRGEPVRYYDSDTQIFATDDEIRDAARKVGRDVSDADLSEIRKALFHWNNDTNADIRRKLLDGRYRVEKRNILDYSLNRNTEEGVVNQDAKRLLEQFGLVKSEVPIEVAETDVDPFSEMVA